jgi:hypothetical protein
MKKDFPDAKIVDCSYLSYWYRKMNETADELQMMIDWDETKASLPGIINSLTKPDEALALLKPTK